MLDTRHAVLILPVHCLTKAKTKGDDRTVDMFDAPPLVEKQVEHRGFVDSHGHYHAPHTQTHQVRAEEPRKAEAPAVKKEEQKQETKPDLISSVVQEIDDDHPAPIPRRAIAHLSEKDQKAWISHHQMQHQLIYHDMPKHEAAWNVAHKKKMAASAEMRKQEEDAASFRTNGPFMDEERAKLHDESAAKFRAEYNKHRATEEQHEKAIKDLHETAIRHGWKKEELIPESSNLRYNLTSGTFNTAADEKENAAYFKRMYREYFKNRKPTEQKEQPKPEPAKPTDQQLAGNREEILAQVDALIERALAGKDPNNVNLKAFKAKLQRMRNMVAAGDTNALTSTAWGVNTYGKAVAQLAAESAKLLQQAPVAVEAKKPEVLVEKPVEKAPAAAIDEGPKEGDTKTEDGITYVLWDGRWHRAEPEPVAEDEPPAEKQRTPKELVSLGFIPYDNLSKLDHEVYDAAGVAHVIETLKYRHPGVQFATATDSRGDTSVWWNLELSNIEKLRYRITKLGGQIRVASEVKAKLRDPNTRDQANAMIERLASATGLSRDDVLAELGIKQVTRTPRAAPKPKPAAPEPAETATNDDLDPSSPNYRYRDTGYVAGSRKEEAANMLRTAKRTGTQVRHTAIDWEQLEQNPREAKEVITKSHLFGKVDWEALKAGGMEPGAGFLVDRVYAAVGTEPKNDTPDGRQDYTLALESLRDRMERCKTADDVTNLLGEIQHEHEGYVLSIEETKKIIDLKKEYNRILAPQREYNTQESKLEQEFSYAIEAANSLGDKVHKRGFISTPEYEKDVENANRRHDAARAALQAFKDEHPEMERKYRNGWTTFESDLEEQARPLLEEIKQIRQFAQIRTMAAPHSLYQQWSQLGDRFVAAIRYNRYKGSDAFGKHVSTVKAGHVKDWSWAEKEAPRVRQATDESTRFQLQVADRFDRVGGRTVAASSTDALKSAFNLRDVQSGNWVLRDVNSAKFHVEQTAGALADLADLIGADDQHVAMNGRLAIAFGARGQGNAGGGGAARAHYEPVHRIINLTKMGGGGSLGHEWFHALDNLLSEHYGIQGAANDYMSEDSSKIPAGPVRDAFNGLRSALTDGPHRLQQTMTYTAADVRRAGYNIDRSSGRLAKIIKDAGDVHNAVQSLERDFGAQMATSPASHQRKLKKYLKDWSQLAAAYYGGNAETGGEIQVQAGNPMSSFQHEAVILDKGDHGKYWSSVRELASRAFSSWCEDRLSDKGRRNDYLAVMSDNKYYDMDGVKPFPEGEERTRINAAFDRLFAALADDRTLAKALGL